MAINAPDPIKPAGKIIQCNFPLSLKCNYAKHLSYNSIDAIRNAIIKNTPNKARGFSRCHLSMLNSIAMENLVNSVK